MNVQSLDDLVEEVNELVKSFLENGTENIRPEAFGLDRRAGHNLFLSADNDCIGVEGQHGRNSLNYYGGFEYVDAEDIKCFGDWTFYSANSQRVRDHIERYLDNQDDSGEDEAPR